ncbi:MAG: hypothetical protein E6G47_08565 [Actinobacteria bacterium]|nr:MAG: hypothetical protein E6G47_08565 [Actinomycetota bacterium]
MKKTFLVVLAASVVLLPASTAWARGDGWQPLPTPPSVDVFCGSTVVHLTFPVNKEYGIFTTEPDGTVVLKVTGSLFLTFTTDAGASFSTNSSGPGELFFYTNGDFETIAQGLSTEAFSAEQAADLGLPSEITLLKGPLDFVLHPDGSATPIRIPSVVTDICAQLGV